MIPGFLGTYAMDGKPATEGAASRPYHPTVLKTTSNLYDSIAWGDLNRTPAWWHHFTLCRSAARPKRARTPHSDGWLVPGWSLCNKNSPGCASAHLAGAPGSEHAVYTFTLR